MEVPGAGLTAGATFDFLQGQHVAISSEFDSQDWCARESKSRYFGAGGGYLTCRLVLEQDLRDRGSFLSSIIMFRVGTNSGMLGSKLTDRQTAA